MSQSAGQMCMGMGFPMGMGIPWEQGWKKPSFFKKTFLGF